MMFLAAMIAIFISMALVIIRAMLGPTPHDRMLAANLFGTNTVILIVLIGAMVDNPMYLDIALVYALINFTSTIAFLKFFKNKSFGSDTDN